MKIRIQFENIDNWNRPVFRAVNDKGTLSKMRFGDVNNLFGYDEPERETVGWQQYLLDIKENPNFFLCYFGKSFNCEPQGGLNPDVKLILITK